MSNRDGFDSYAYGYANGYKRGLEGIERYSKALDNACEYLADGYGEIPTQFTTKEQWKEWLLKDE